MNPPTAPSSHRLRFGGALAAFCLIGLDFCAAQALPPRPEQQNISTNRADELFQLDAVSVTGSNLRRAEAETALPITVLDQSDIEIRGGSTGADLFATLTFAAPPQVNETVIASQGARADVNLVDLRGIGAGSTLLLINGRRIAPHPISGTENGVPSLSPNANDIPTALLTRVEILRDGASAIYGADAAAGVINNIITPTGEGGKYSMRGVVSQHGGANEARVVATQGFTSGNAHISVALDVFHRDAMTAHDREWSSQSDLRLSRNLPAPWNGLPVTDPTTGLVTVNNALNLSGTIGNYGEYQRGAIQSDYVTFVGSRPANNVGISTATAPLGGVATTSSTGIFYLYPTTTGGVNFKQTTPSKDPGNQENGFYGNPLTYRTLVPRTDRANVALFLDQAIRNNLALFGDLIFSSARSFSGREPVNIQNVNEPGIYVPASNPYNPFGSHFYDPKGTPNPDGSPRLVGTPADVTIISGVTPLGTKPHMLRVDSYFFRGLTGLRGKFADGWRWESAVLYSGAQSLESETNNWRESILRQELARTDSTAFNPFPTTFKVVGNTVVADKPYVNPASVIDPMTVTTTRLGVTKLFSWDAKADGELWRLFQGGRMQAAGGAEFRWESYDNKQPTYVGVNPPGSGQYFPYLRDNDNDIVAMSPNVPLSSTQSIYSVYGEVGLPFVTPANHIPLVNQVEVNLAGRFEHFSIVGSDAKPKASIDWNPFAWLKLRSSYNESFRAPNLVEVNTSPTLRVSSAADPYRGDVTGALADTSSPRKTYKQGAGSLKPETAKNWSLGFVLDVPVVRGLSFTLDYWRMSQKNPITTIALAQTLQIDELELQVATQKALAAGTPIDQINLNSGAPGYQGYAEVTRLPVTDADRASFAAYNAAQPTNATKRAPVGAVSSVIIDYVNLGSRELAGLELGAEYRLPKLTIGQITLKAEATNNLRRDETLTTAGTTVNSLGKDGYTPWRANATFDWRSGPWSAGWFVSYFGSFASTGATTTQAVYNALGHPGSIKPFTDNGITSYYLEVDPFIQHNAYVAYRFANSSQPWLRGVSVRLGVNNVLDAVPPPAALASSYQVGTADPRGRQFTMELSRQF
jgi:outer membrane receptor protein involved in Fe transport